MARKPCAQDVPQIEDICDISCNLGPRRFRRIARNAIMPFYYNCNKCAKFANPKELDSNGCLKIFYIKNPAFYSGSYNDSVKIITQKSIYSYIANLKSKTPHGNKKRIQLDYPSKCNKTDILDFHFEKPKTSVSLYSNYLTIKGYTTIDKNNLFPANFNSNFVKCNCSQNVFNLKN